MSDKEVYIHKNVYIFSNNQVLMEIISLSAFRDLFGRKKKTEKKNQSEEKRFFVFECSNGSGKNSLPHGAIKLKS